MSQSELREHRRYLSDRPKWRAYRAALDEVVRKGDVVLDLGTGSGMLGYLACDAGAGTVVAADNRDVIGLARQIAEKNGYGDRITHVKKLSTDLSLDPLADVIVCDQIGGLVHDAGILGYFSDARRRLLAPGGRLVPASFRLLLAPVAFPRARELIEFWGSTPEGLDVRPARGYAVNTEWRFELRSDDVKALASGQELAAFESHHDEPIAGGASFIIDRAGQFDGFIGWFVARMSPSVTMTNDPFSSERFDRWCNFLPMDAPVALKTGDIVDVQLDIRSRLDITTWSTHVERDRRPLLDARQSTLNGRFLAKETLGSHRRDQPIDQSPVIGLAREILDLVNGARSRADIETLMARHVGSAFVSRDELQRFIHTVLVSIGRAR
jgi:type I protein arginine methyltransferase